MSKLFPDEDPKVIEDVPADKDIPMGESIIMVKGGEFEIEDQRKPKGSKPSEVSVRGKHPNLKPLLPLTGLIVILALFVFCMFFFVGGGNLGYKSNGSMGHLSELK